jgi:transcriptional regulator with XRE-family HTH domain
MTPGALLARYLEGPPRITQRELADRVGVHQSLISQIVSGARTPSGQLALSLHQETGIPVDQLLVRRPISKQAEYNRRKDLERLRELAQGVLVRVSYQPGAGYVVRTWADGPEDFLIAGRYEVVSAYISGFVQGWLTGQMRKRT